ncbi:MAG: VanZ family protein [Candidatus Moranbacteria bacterium]|nr:VanZ family protein [Candidatus Moranbacteria bacterium]
MQRLSFSFLIFYFIPVLLWGVGIFYLSSIPALGVREGPSVWFFLERKGAHVFEYFLLTILVLRLAYFYVRRDIVSLVLFSCFFVLLYAMSDEFHQTFVLGREGAVRDVLIDSVGIVLGVCVFLFLVRRKRIG